MAVYRFPDDFIWGAATASYQIEGSPLADGAGESIWHRFSHTPGKVKNGDTGDVADDHYHRWAEDIELMRWLGLDAYRFSIAWPRLFPHDEKAFNERGFAFYDRLVDGLLAAGITPFVTLYHWDLPGWADDRGGWLTRDCASWFADYASAVYDRLGDRVQHWITHNEPWVTAFLGYYTGELAPGHTDAGEAVTVSYNLLLSHGLALERFRGSGKKGEIGITLNMSEAIPASDSEADQRAARLYDGFLNRWFIEPLTKGCLPQDVAAVFRQGGAVPPEPTADDMAKISAPIDFLGLNYYSVATIKALDQFPGFRQQPPPDRPLNPMGWEIEPEGLRHLLLRLHNEYTPVPIYITENGYPTFDGDKTGEALLEDQPRLDYIRDHLIACWRAMHEGVPLKGYFVWSLLDNFEWAQGYAARFGIVRVDYKTLERLPRASARWYREVIEQNAVVV